MAGIEIATGELVKKPRTRRTTGSRYPEAGDYVKITVAPYLGKIGRITSRDGGYYYIKLRYQRFESEFYDNEFKVIKKKLKCYVQILNPKSKRFVKLNISDGVIVGHKKTPGPYKNIPIKNES